MIFDAQLTSQGRALAMAAEMHHLIPKPEVCLVSPLRRCMETAHLALSTSGIDCEMIAEPLLRERLMLSSDVGSLKSGLKRDFPSISFPDMEGMEEEWWFAGEGGNNTHSCDRIDKEPAEQYEARLQVLRSKLRARRESCILLVSHWGVFNSITGLDLAPAQIATFDLTP